VPLIVYDPRLPAERRGTRVQDFALSIDAGPTMLDLAGIEIPGGMQGRSLVPVVAGRTPQDWRTEYYYEHYFEPDPNWKMTIPRNEGIRTERWKYIQYIDSDPLYEELYDLHVDYDETTNLAFDPQHADRIQDFRRRLIQMRAAAQ
jgi:arylsulfatase A-like enzyme